MALSHSPKIVTSGLVMCLDAANRRSYPGVTGPELVTNPVITSQDGVTFNVLRTASVNNALALCNVQINKTYIVEYVISSYTGTTSATFRVDGAGAGGLNPTIGISSAGTFVRIFTATITGGLTINGDNTGTDFQVDYVSVKEVLGNSSTTWYDLSGTGNNGTLTNSPTFVSSNKGEISFDGTNDYISTTFDASWNHTNSVSISLFLKPTSLTSYYPFIGKGPSNWEWQLLQKTSSLEFVYWNTGGGHSNGAIPNITNFFTDLNYVNVFLVWSHLDNSYYFYRNGELVNTTVWIDATINQNRTDGINIGGNLYTWASNGSFWPGSIGQVLFYNRALNASEVRQNYNATRSRFGL